MSNVFQNAAVLALIGAVVTGCGGLPGGNRDARNDPAPANPAPTNQVATTTAPSVDDLYALNRIEDVRAAFQRQANQDGVEAAINDARQAQFTDVQIAEAMGDAWLRTPQKRVMLSVAFVRFKEDSPFAAPELDAAYEAGRTPQRAAATAPAPAPEPEEEEAEDEGERQGGWRRWVPGL